MIESGRDITKAIIKLNMTEADFAKKCGVTRASIYNWTKQRKLSLLHKRIVESVIKEEEGYFIDRDSIVKHLPKDFKITNRFLKELNLKIKTFVHELAKKKDI